MYAGTLPATWWCATCKAWTDHRRVYVRGKTIYDGRRFSHAECLKCKP